MKEHTIYDANGKSVLWTDMNNTNAAQGVADALFIVECVNGSGGLVSTQRTPPPKPLDARGIPMGSQQGKTDST